MWFDVDEGAGFKRHWYRITVKTKTSDNSSVFSSIVRKRLPTVNLDLTAFRPWIMSIPVFVADYLVLKLQNETRKCLHIQLTFKPFVLLLLLNFLQFCVIWVLDMISCENFDRSAVRRSDPFSKICLNHPPLPPYLKISVNPFGTSLNNQLRAMHCEEAIMSASLLWALRCFGKNIPFSALWSKGLLIYALILLLEQLGPGLLEQKGPGLLAQGYWSS